jgi:hypothetical protein
VAGPDLSPVREGDEDCRGEREQDHELRPRPLCVPAVDLEGEPGVAPGLASGLEHPARHLKPLRPASEEAHARRLPAFRGG